MRFVTIAGLLLAAILLIGWSMMKQPTYFVCDGIETPNGTHQPKKAQALSASMVVYPLLNRILFNRLGTAAMVT